MAPTSHAAISLGFTICLTLETREEFTIPALIALSHQSAGINGPPGFKAGSWPTFKSNDFHSLARISILFWTLVSMWTYWSWSSPFSFRAVQQRHTVGLMVSSITRAQCVVFGRDALSSIASCQSSGDHTVLASFDMIV